METLAYAVHLEPAKEGGYVVTCRDLPEVVTQGDTLQDALMQASDAMDEAFAARIDDGENFPVPSTPRRGEYVVAPSSDLSAKAALYLAIREAAVSKAGLARTLQMDEKEVRRLLDPHHPSKLPRMEKVLRALGKRLVLSVQPVPAVTPSTRGTKALATRAGPRQLRKAQRPLRRKRVPEPA
ncbi:MAG TPA: type II toxin-antitoxin system HicB family antitoxin [Casimicrobiaceae bacterium]